MLAFTGRVVILAVFNGHQAANHCLFSQNSLVESYAAKRYPVRCRRWLRENSASQGNIHVSGFIKELQRRKVFRVGIAYMVVAWLIIQVAATAFPSFGIPDWVMRLIMLLALLGFPLALVLAWTLELTPEGIKSDVSQVGSKRMFTIAAILAALGIGWYLQDQQSDPPVPQGFAERSIAVLPFVNMSADPEQDYFSDGISEELLNRLAQIPDLKVAARTSAFQFKGKNLDIGDIGRQLKVAHVLEGSVRQGGSMLRITAQLIDSQTGYHLWSETYDRDASDVLKVQDEIATSIANALQSKLGGSPVVSAPAQKVSPAAYDDYLQGRAYVARRYLDNLDKALIAFDRAITKDPAYSAAWSGRAFTTTLRPLWGAPADTSLIDARNDAEKALQLDPNNAEAYMVRGMIAIYSHDATSAEIDLDRARILAPGSVDALNMDGDLHMFIGSLGEAEQLKRQAMALDPLAFVHPLNMVDILVPQGRYEEAITMAEQAIALGAKGYGYDRLIFAYLRAGRFEEAREVLERGCAMSNVPKEKCDVNRALFLAASGARELAETLLDKIADNAQAAEVLLGPDAPVTMASLYLEVPDIGKATEWQKIVLGTDNWFPTNVLLNAPGGAQLPEEISTDADWLAVWDDPRISNLMAAYRRDLLAWRSERN